MRRRSPRNSSLFCRTRVSSRSSAVGRWHAFARSTTGTTLRRRTAPSINGFSAQPARLTPCDEQSGGMSRILVTGAAGVVGGYVADVFGNHELVLTDIRGDLESLDVRDP